MSVQRRKTTGGFTEEYHYEFRQSGKRYRGVCEGCTTKRAAEEFEKQLREKTKEAASQRNVKNLVEHFRDVLSGGTDILLVDAYERSLEKPKKRMPSEELIRTKRSYWKDFVAFMAETYPEIKKMTEVRPLHAESYIQYLRQNGRFNKVISYTGRTVTTERSYVLSSALSAKTINTYQQVLTEVFQLLMRDVGLPDNPFARIPLLTKESETREAFSEEELQTISKNMDGFTGPLFTIAIATALREGDICTLKWADINFANDTIVKRMRKTGHIVEIPIMPPLKGYLQQIKSARAIKGDEFDDYVFPEHAKMYLSNSSGISYRIKQFLEKDCGITTTKVPNGRDRAISVKDLHSCRHTFCYYAGLYGIPLSIVQSIVGHMTPEMTKHYSAHASMEAKREKMQQLPSFLMLNASASTEISDTRERQELLALVRTMPINQVHKLLQMLKK